MAQADIQTADPVQLQDEVSRLEDEIHRITNKLQNEGFISRVPAAMIEKEQTKLAKYEKACKTLRSQLKAIAG
ncbi:MAG: hypothetical protein VW258_06755 [Thalassolituus sp.]